MSLPHFGRSYERNISPHVNTELQTAIAMTAQGQAKHAFAHLERAHVLGQASTLLHVKVHWHMFLWGVQHRSLKECLGQLLRIGGAATKTVFGLIPQGNTGGANVSPFKPLPISPELEMLIQQARKSG
jgi:hypothetical protein